jgi:hypothetical protein
VTAAKRTHGLLDGSTSRTLILLASLAATSLLCWAGKVDAQAFVAIVSLVLGGVVHASGTNQGSQASVDPPPES